MALTHDEVNRIAELARLELAEEEVRRLTGELGSILEHMGELAKAEIEGVEPLGGVSELPAPMRADEPGADPLQLSLDQVAPQWQERFFVVPRLAALDADALPEGESDS